MSEIQIHTYETCPEICTHCEQEVWFDEDSETYETMTGVFICVAAATEDSPFAGHEPAL